MHLGKRGESDLEEVEAAHDIRYMNVCAEMWRKGRIADCIT